jgi:dipeptidyl aminopeptidase/acylaminoacyl peptidase
MMFGGIVAGEKNDLYFMGGSPSTPSAIYKWNIESKETATVLACSSSLTFPDEVISVPKQVEFPTTMGSAFGYYYAPKNGKYKCTTDKAPPLLVKAHGGPTSCTGSSFNAAIQVRNEADCILEFMFPNSHLFQFSIGPLGGMLFSMLTTVVLLATVETTVVD